MYFRAVGRRYRAHSSVAGPRSDEMIFWDNLSLPYSNLRLGSCRSQDSRGPDLRSAVVQNDIRPQGGLTYFDCCIARYLSSSPLSLVIPAKAGTQTITILLESL